MTDWQIIDTKIHQEDCFSYTKYSGCTKYVFLFSYKLTNRTVYSSVKHILRFFQKNRVDSYFFIRFSQSHAYVDLLRWYWYLWFTFLPILHDNNGKLDLP